MITTSTGCGTFDPISFEIAHFPFLFPLRIIFQRIRIQVDDFQSWIMCAEITERHPKLAVVAETQTNFFLLIIRDKLPLGRPVLDEYISKMSFYFFVKTSNCLFHQDILITPSTFPFGLVSPRISNADHWNLASHARGTNIHHFDASNTVSMSFNQAKWRLCFQNIRIRLILKKKNH